MKEILPDWGLTDAVFRQPREWKRNMDDNKIGEEMNPKSSSKKTTVFKASTFVAGLTVLSAFAGFGIALGRVRKKNRGEFSQVEATRLAMRALGLGTLLSLTGCGVLVFSVKWALQIDSIQQFGDVVRSKMPQKDGDFVKRFESWKIPRKATDDKKEWEEAIS